MNHLQDVRINSYSLLYLFLELCLLVLFPCELLNCLMKSNKTIAFVWPRLCSLLEVKGSPCLNYLSFLCGGLLGFKGFINKIDVCLLTISCMSSFVVGVSFLDALHDSLIIFCRDTCQVGLCINCG